MNEIERLVDKVKNNDADKQFAVSRLLEIGVAIVPVLLNDMRNSPIGVSISLSEVLLQIRDPNIIPVLLGLLHDNNSSIAVFAFRGLARFQDKRILQTMIDYLLATDNLKTPRAMAAEVLGELGDTKAIPGLLSAAEEAVKDKMFDLFIPIAVALAKLGNNQESQVVLAIASQEKDEVKRASAIQALQIIIAPGMYQLLKKALHDDYYEVRQAALDAVFYLGIKEAISDLIDCVEDEDPDIAEKVIVRLHDLTGEFFERNQIQKIREWWENNQMNFDSSICYRLGKPIWLPDIIALLEVPELRLQIIEELKVITGTDFGFNPYIPHTIQHELLNRAHIWWQNERQRFEDGNLYKYGYYQDIQIVY